MNFPYGPYLEVLNFIRKFPEGCTSIEIGKAFPHLDADTRGVIMYRLRIRGFVARAYGKKSTTIWVALK